MSDLEWVKSQLEQQARAISSKQPYHASTVGFVMTAALAKIRHLEETLRSIGNTFDESWLEGSLELSVGNKCRRALGESEVTGRPVGTRGPE